MNNRNYIPKIVLTGGAGFVGSHLLKNDFFHQALAIGRTKPAYHKNFKSVSLTEDNNLKKILKDVDIVVHLAARAHVMNDNIKNPIDNYRKANKFITLNLAEQAAIAGVKRFIFISTIKVLGEKLDSGLAFKYSDACNPQDPYSISKYEAEIGLKDIGKKYKMEIVIIRPPLIYGQGVRGNFSMLLKLVKLSIPLPIRSIKNKRSLVSVHNLVDLIVVCLRHPNAKNQTFLVSDDDDMSTPILFSRLAEAGGYKAYIFSFPLVFLYLLSKLFFKLEFYSRLCCSMRVNIEYTKAQLNWKPPYSVKQCLASCWLKDN
jgi:nucleoside-diphosphate-sugar epimerase